MPPSEIATLSLGDTAEIGALFEWAPSKVSELDPTLYQDSDKSDYAELVTLLTHCMLMTSRLSTGGHDTIFIATDEQR